MDFKLLYLRDSTKAKTFHESMSLLARTVSIFYAWDLGRLWMWGADSTAWHFMLRPV
jgi:hypothetical protein